MLGRRGNVDDVRVVQLSDHPGDMLRQERKRRSAGDEQAQRRQAAAVARHRDQVARLRRARDRARAERRWLDWLRGILAVRRMARHAPQPPIPAAAPSDQEEAMAAGARGEQAAAADLGGALGDEWTLLRGYCNRRGEIDHLLLGPGGLLAIEVKNRNGLISCSGDRWFILRYDRYGNRVSAPEAMADRGDRSPSEQLNQPADALRDFLSSRGHRVTIDRVVWFTHPRARLGNCTSPTVSIAFSVDQVLSRIGRSPAALADSERADIERLIIQDHRFHEDRRGRTQRPGKRTG
jgi:hypothetical protein